MTPDLIAGRYRVVRPIGRGGFGTVWLCRDEVLGREVAVKQVGVLPGESAPDAARALREARSSAALNHRNVVSVFDIVDDEEGGVWLVMEYVPSRTLAQVINEDGPLPPRRAARIGAQVAAGLAAAHAAGTIHRDVKPGNVLVSDDDLAKISDFGIARGADDEQLTRTGLVTGTPSYFSPELARGGDPAPASDVYALGATLYFATEGRPPYPEQRNAILMLQQIAAAPPPPPGNAGPLTGPVDRMMDRDPRTRWTMADAAQALRRLGEQDDREADTRDGAVGGAAAGAGTTADGADTAHDDTRGDALTTGPAAAPPAAPRGDDRQDSHRRRGALPWLAGAGLLLLLLLGGGYMLISDDGEEPARAPAPSAEESASPAPSRSPAPTPSPSPEEETPPTDREDATGPAALEGTVRDYFAAMPDDTDTGWQMLAPSMKAQGRGSYESFWGDVDAVDLHRASATGSDQVEIDLTYRFADGSATRETQLLTLERRGGDYLIADDEVVSSRSAS